MEQPPSNFNRWRGAAVAFALSIVFTIAAILLWRQWGMPAVGAVIVSSGFALWTLFGAIATALNIFPTGVKDFIARMRVVRMHGAAHGTTPQDAAQRIATLDDDVRTAIVEFGPSSTDALLATFNRATVKSIREDHAGAEADFSWCIAWHEARIPPQHADLAKCYADRGHSRFMSGNHKGAEADLSRSIALTEAYMPGNATSLARDYSLRAAISEKLGDASRAETDLTRAIEHYATELSLDAWELDTAYASRSWLREGRGDLAGAEADIQVCIDRNERRVPINTEMLASYLFSRGVIRWEQNRLDEAKADLLQSLVLKKACPLQSEESLASIRATRALLDDWKPM